jgi:hypothetical protein
MGVMLAYSGAMMQVQVFERNLAILVLTMEAKPGRTQPFKSPEQFQTHVGRLITRSMNTFQKATARQLRNRLPKDFDPDLLAEIEPLIEWRDRLAHRYLYERMSIPSSGSGPRLKAEAFGELLDVSKHFQATAAKLHERMLARLAEFPKADVPEGVRDVFTALGRTMLLGEDFKVLGLDATQPEAE